MGEFSAQLLRCQATIPCSMFLVLSGLCPKHAGEGTGNDLIFATLSSMSCSSHPVSRGDTLHQKQDGQWISKFY